MGQGFSQNSLQLDVKTLQGNIANVFLNLT